MNIGKLVGGGVGRRLDFKQEKPEGGKWRENVLWMSVAGNTEIREQEIYFRNKILKYS